MYHFRPLEQGAAPQSSAEFHGMDPLHATIEDFGRCHDSLRVLAVAVRTSAHAVDRCQSLHDASRFTAHLTIHTKDFVTTEGRGCSRGEEED